jgi:hypothetical protein
MEINAAKTEKEQRAAVTRLVNRPEARMGDLNNVAMPARMVGLYSRREDKVPLDGCVGVSNLGVSSCRG